MKLVKKSLPYVTVFITSMGIMIIELVASRLVAKHFGNSLYTWTGVIGVVLAGISLGNYIGGRLADRFQPKKLISPLLIIASLLVFLILLLDFTLSSLLEDLEFSIVTSAVVIRSFVVIVVLFLFPSTALGTISPVMAKYALSESDRVGKTVGSIYAISAVGSIVGTFLSGYLLIPLLGIRSIVFIVGGVIAFLALATGAHKIISSAWIALIGVTFLFSAFTGHSSERLLYATDTQYSHLKVMDVDNNRKLERVLIMDGLIHNRYDPTEPENLLYEYERMFASLTRDFLMSRSQEGFTTLTLGGGACVFPTFLERRYPESLNEVVEIDPEVLRIAYEYFDAPAGLNMIEADGRNYVNFMKGKRRYDLIFLDAFNSFSVPHHLTTREFTEAASTLLEPGGLVMANCIDILTLGKFLTAYMNTLASVFPHVSVYVSTENSPHTRSTFVLAASHTQIESVALKDERGVVYARRMSEAEMEDLIERNGKGYLTDDYAPVENFIAPVYLMSLD